MNSHYNQLISIIYLPNFSLTVLKSGSKVFQLFPTTVFQVGWGSQWNKNQNRGAPIVFDWFGLAKIRYLDQPYACLDIMHIFRRKSLFD